jgi:hypothetical protein
MQIRQAVLKAADSIEQYPGLFDFSSVVKPNMDCGVPSCAIGWIAFWLGINDMLPIDLFGKVTESLGLGSDFHAATFFYKRMDNVYGDVGWKWSAPECAKALRLYADKYHPDIPESVRRIFDEKPVKRVGTVRLR